MSGVSVVIGAGVVGLACARALALRGLEVLVLESQHMIGSGVSSRNSEVIHAGIYYPKGSIKAHACVEGKRMLYDYCQEREIGHSRCGKLIVATNEEQLGDLQRIQQLAAGNGVEDLRILSVAEVADLEPELRCVGALLSPSTGIVDSHSFMLSLQGDIELHGGCVVLNTPVTRYEVLKSDASNSNGANTTLRVFTGGAEPMEVDCDVLVNAAGLFAPDLASASGVTECPEPYFAKGNYYKLEGCSNPFRRLIYPVPEKNTAGLGVHATLDLAGQLKFGPDVEWLNSVRHASEIDADTYKVRVRSRVGVGVGVGGGGGVGVGVGAGGGGVLLLLETTVVPLELCECSGRKLWDRNHQVQFCWFWILSELWCPFASCLSIHTSCRWILGGAATSTRPFGSMLTEPTTLQCIVFCPFVFLNFWHTNSQADQTWLTLPCQCPQVLADPSRRLPRAGLFGHQVQIVIVCFCSKNASIFVPV